MIHYIKLLRPLQWLKNVFVFAPIFFSTNLLKPEYFWPTLVVFASFCLISSSIYCFNDLKDAEADRMHPKKCKRPIASGKVSVTGGYTMMLLCTIGALAIIPLAHSVNTHYLYAIIIGYWLMNIAYSVTTTIVFMSRRVPNHVCLSLATTRLSSTRPQPSSPRSHWCATSCIPCRQRLSIA